MSDYLELIDDSGRVFIVDRHTFEHMLYLYYASDVIDTICQDISGKMHRIYMKDQDRYVVEGKKKLNIP